MRLLNALMDLSAQEVSPRIDSGIDGVEGSNSFDDPALNVKDLPLTAPRLQIRMVDPAKDLAMLRSWQHDKYGRHFVFSCATAQETDLRELLSDSTNHVGVVSLKGGPPIGAVAFLDHDRTQRRAELRKVIGDPNARGRGYAEEATLLWIKYGIDRLGLDKIYVSTLQTDLRNIRLNERVGLRIEGVLVEEILKGDERVDVLRMGLSCRRTRDGFSF
jgi:RimJ/RimL family protein N-acetyltransferase